MPWGFCICAGAVDGWNDAEMASMSVPEVRLISYQLIQDSFTVCWFVARFSFPSWRTVAWNSGFDSVFGYSKSLWSLARHGRMYPAPGDVHVSGPPTVQSGRVEDFGNEHFSAWVSEWVETQRPTRHFIGHFGDDFYRPDDPTNSVKALKEASWPLREASIPPEPLHCVTVWTRLTVGNRV